MGCKSCGQKYAKIRMARMASQAALSTVKRPKGNTSPGYKVEKAPEAPKPDEKCLNGGYGTTESLQPKPYELKAVGIQGKLIDESPSEDIAEGSKEVLTS